MSFEFPATVAPRDQGVALKFYKRFVGDIQAKTGHLTPAEFGVYDRLLDHYYSTELPLPASIDRCRAIARVMTKADRDALDRVLAEFFDLGADGYSQRRAEVVIAEALPKIEAARANGKKGGRPRKKTEPEPSGFPEAKPTGFEKQNPTETQPKPNLKASQSQSSSNELHPSSFVGGVEGKKRSRRCPRDFEVGVELRAAIEAECPGVDLERETAKFRDWEFRDPKSDWPATWRTWMRKAAESRRVGPGAQSFRQRDEADAKERHRRLTGGGGDNDNVIEMEESEPKHGRLLASR